MKELQQLKKANRVYKLKLANRAGFDTVEQYLNYLVNPEAEGEQKLSLTRVTEQLLKSTKTKIQVVFYKKLREPDFISRVLGIYLNTAPSQYQDTLNEKFPSLIKGELRTMDCVHHGERDIWGRLLVQDISITEQKDRIKTINLLELVSVQVGNQKYIVK